MGRAHSEIRHSDRDNFRRIMAQLDKTKADSKIVKIIAQAQTWLDEFDVGWDVVSMYIPANYVFVSQRRKAKVKPEAVARVVGAVQHGATKIGFDGQDLLRKVLARHPDWPTVRDTLGVNTGSINKQDMIAVAQLLGIDEKFIKLAMRNITNTNGLDKTPIEAYIDNNKTDHSDE